MRTSLKDFYAQKNVETALLMARTHMVCFMAAKVLPK